MFLVKKMGGDTIHRGARMHHGMSSCRGLESGSGGDAIGRFSLTHFSQPITSKFPSDLLRVGGLRSRARSRGVLPIMLFGLDLGCEAGFREGHAKAPDFFVGNGTVEPNNDNKLRRRGAERGMRAKDPITVCLAGEYLDECI